MNYPIEDYIINFLERKESPEDVQKLKEWLAADPARRNDLKQWLAAWDSVGMMAAIEKIDPEKAYQRFLFRAGADTAPKTASKTAPKRFRMDTAVFKTIRRIAAIFVISFSLGVLCHYYLAKNQSEQIAFVENVVPLGSKSEIKMPDGSSVWLNAGSTLRYPTNYGKTKRDIYLSGEGYFKVIHQPQKPFTVHTTLAKITALGTEFNVKAYPDENVVETTVIKGELAVENGEAANAFDRTLLKPGQKFLVTNSDQKIKDLNTDAAEAEVSWKERNWRIEGVLLKDLAVQLERRYDVRITVDEQLKNRLFSGTFENETLEQALNIMQHILPIQFHIDGKNVAIYVDPKRMD